MRRPYQITGIVLVVLSALVVRESIELVYYTDLGPGPGFFPFWLGLLWGVLGVFIWWQATFRGVEPMPADFFTDRAGYMRIAAILAALGMVVLLMKPLGFRLSILAFLLFLLFALGRQRLLVTLAVALAGSFGTYYVFTKWLQVQLPVGLLGI